MTDKEINLATRNAMLEDLFDVINGNTKYITLEEFQKIYGFAEYNGPNGGSSEPFLLLNGFQITAA